MHSLRTPILLLLNHLCTYQNQQKRNADSAKCIGDSAKTRLLSASGSVNQLYIFFCVGPQTVSNSRVSGQKSGGCDAHCSLSLSSQLFAFSMTLVHRYLTAIVWRRILWMVVLKIHPLLRETHGAIFLLNSTSLRYWIPFRVFLFLFWSTANAVILASLFNLEQHPDGEDHVIHVWGWELSRVRFWDLYSLFRVPPQFRIRHLSGEVVRAVWWDFVARVDSVDTLNYALLPQFCTFPSDGFTPIFFLSLSNFFSYTHFSSF